VSETPNSGAGSPRQPETVQQPGQALIYQGASIAVDGEMLNLTDMWRAAGSNPFKRPADWARKEGADFIRHVADIVIMPQGLIKAERGRGGATLAHWQIGLAYAKYLSADFHMWCNTAVRERMEGRQSAIDLNDPAALRHLLVDYTEKVLKLQHENEAMLPKVAALDRIATADGSHCITDAAKLLQMRPKDLFTYLGKNGWIYRRPGCDHWCAYQSKLVTGDLEHKVTTVLRSDGSEKTTEQVRVTPAGLVKLAKLVGSAASGVGEAA
jgi:phage antirepressor YoqD-like protein